MDLGLIGKTALVSGSTAGIGLAIASGLAQEGATGYVNVLSGVRLSRQYLPGMLKNNWGRIMFISSESGLQIPIEMIHYGMTKTAQLAVARGLAESVAGTGVTVNSVLPGPTRSEGVEGFIKDMARTK